MRQLRWQSACTGAVLAVALVAAGCGSSNSSSKSSSNSSGSASRAASSTPTKSAVPTSTPINAVGAGLLIPPNLPAGGSARADAGFNQFAKQQSPIPVSVPVGKPIPTGKKLDFLNCGIPYCKSLYTASQVAAAKLGWTVTSVAAGLTPETIQQGWTQVVRDKPDGVIATGYPRQLFQQQLAQLQAKNIPVVECCISEQAGDGIVTILNPGPQGAEMAWSAVHFANNPKANILYVDDKDFPIIDQIFTPEFKSEIAKTCPGCTVSTINVPTTSFGTSLPNTIVSYLRSHPQVDYLVLGNGGMAIGLPQALAAAGLKIPYVEDNPDIINQKYISSGQEQAGVAFPGKEMMAQLIDTLARTYAGVSTSADDTPPYTMILTKANLQDPATYPTVYPNYLDQYAKLWGK